MESVNGGAYKISVYRKEFTEHLDKKRPSPHGGRSSSYFATTFSFPKIPSNLVSTKGVAFMRRLDA